MGQTLLLSLAAVLKANQWYRRAPHVTSEQGLFLKGKAQGLVEDESGHPDIIPPSRLPAGACPPLPFFVSLDCPFTFSLHFCLALSISRPARLIYRRSALLWPLRCTCILSTLLHTGGGEKLKVDVLKLEEDTVLWCWRHRLNSDTIKTWGRQNALVLWTKTLDQGSSNLSLEGQSATDFSSNPAQTHLPVIF